MFNIYNYHFSGLCSVFFHVLRGTYAPIGVGQIIINGNSNYYYINIITQ